MSAIIMHADVQKFIFYTSHAEALSIIFFSTTSDIGTIVVYDKNKNHDGLDIFWWGMLNLSVLKTNFQKVHNSD